MCLRILVLPTQPIFEVAISDANAATNYHYYYHLSLAQIHVLFVLMWCYFILALQCLLCFALLLSSLLACLLACLFPQLAERNETSVATAFCSVPISDDGNDLGTIGAVTYAPASVASAVESIMESLVQVCDTFLREINVVKKWHWHWHWHWHWN